MRYFSAVNDTKASPPLDKIAPESPVDNYEEYELGEKYVYCCG